MTKEIYKTFEQWMNGNFLEVKEPRKKAYSKDELLLVEMGWKYGYDAGRAVEQALDKKAENARELGLDYEPVLKDNSNYRYDPPVAEPVAYLCENAVGHKYFRWKKPSSTYKPIALYTTPPAQPSPVQPVGTYGEIHESMQALLRSGLQRDQQIYMAMKDRPLYTTPPAAQPAQQEPINVAQAYAMAQVCLDLHDALGCKWGDNPYLTISQLKAAAQPAPVQEPVAWTVSGKITDWSKDFSAYQTKHYTRPVYTPPAAPVQEPESFEQWNAKQHADPEEIGFLQALRIAYCAGQDSVTNTIPPAAQRQLVGLTFGEICEAEVIATDEHNNFSLLTFARAIEAKLRSKNNG